MTRGEAYNLVEAERAAQDATWRTGRPNEAQYRFAAPHILLIEEQVAKLRSIWYASKSEDLVERLVKIISTSVRALEEINL